MTRRTSLALDCASGLAVTNDRLEQSAGAAILHDVVGSAAAVSHRSSSQVSSSLGRSSTTTDNMGCCEMDDFRGVCEQLSGAETKLAALQAQMDSGFQPSKAYVLQIRQVLQEVVSQIDEFNDVARGIQSASNISSVLASSDVTEDAIRMLVALDSGLYLNRTRISSKIGRHFLMGLMDGP